jgi:hypothetical protein
MDSGPSGLLPPPDGSTTLPTRLYGFHEAIQVEAMPQDWIVPLYRKIPGGSRLEALLRIPTCNGHTHTRSDPDYTPSPHYTRRT